MSFTINHITSTDSVLWTKFLEGIALAYQQFAATMFETTGELYSDDLRDLIDHLDEGGCITIQVEHGEKVVALAVHSRIDCRVSLAVLWVRPKRRGRGLATSLMNSVATYYENVVSGPIEVEVDVPCGDVDLIGYYEQKGFEVEMTTLVKTFPRTRTVDCTIEEV